MQVAIIAENKKIITTIQLIVRDVFKDKIEIFFTAEEALLFGNRYQTIDVVIIDIDFLKSSYWDTLSKLRMVNSQLKFIFLAKKGKEAAKAYDHNVDDYIIKPITEERLKQSLEKINKKHESNLQEKISTPISKKKKILCLRKFEIIVEDKILKWNSRKAEELVAYLLEKREISVHKEKILKDIWPEYDYEKGLKLLRMAVFRARQSLEEVKDSIKIHYALDYYRITIDGCFCEWEILDKIAKKMLVPTSEMMVKIFNWYRGNAYLEENGWLWSYPRSSLYEEKLKDYIDFTELCEG